MSKKPKDDVQFSEAVTTYDKNGNPIKTVNKTPLTPAEKPKTPKQMRQEYLRRLGVYQAFLVEHPELKALINAAIKDYKNGDPWDQDRFNAAYSNTTFAKERQKAEEEFDLGMGGANADTYLKKIEDSKNVILQTASRLGITLTDQEAEEQARKMVRSNLPQTSLDLFWSDKYKAGTSDTEASRLAGEPLSGTTGQIQDRLTSIASNYGLKLDQSMIRRKTGEALAQGERWEEWMQGQENLFRQQAKLMYPGAADLLDAYTLKDIAEPYFNDAADLLGKTVEQMDLTDPMWTGFLNGEGGRILTKDEWNRVLRTDPKYGYDSTDQARREASSLATAMLSAFAMA